MYKPFCACVHAFPIILSKTQGMKLLQHVSVNLMKPAKKLSK